jgi:hypothetical protein
VTAPEPEILGKRKGIKSYAESDSEEELPLEKVAKGKDAKKKIYLLNQIL